MTSKRVQQIVKSLDAKVQKLLKPDRFYVALYDEVRSELSFLLVNGKKNVVWESRSYIPAKFPDRVIEKQSQIFFEKDAAIQMEAEGANCWSDEQKPASWLGVPMIFEERVLGVLVVESQMPQAFGERGLRVLNTMAKQTASAIENARLYEHLNRRIKDLDAVNEIGQELTSGIQLEESEILALIHKQANKLIHADNMYIALYDEAQDEIRFPLIYVGGEKIEVAARKLDRNQMGKTEYIILERDSLFHATRAESKAWYDQPGHADHIANPLASWIGVPMIVRDKVIGVIAAYHEEQDYIYDDHDLLILQSMASQAAIALDNARLYKQERQRAQQFEALQDIGIKITSLLDMDEVLGKIAEHAKKLMAADFITLFLYDAEHERFERGIRKGVDEKPTIPTGDSYVYDIANNQEAIFYSGKDDSRKYPVIPIDGRESVSFAGIPLVIKERTVGVLLVNYFNPHRFSIQEKEIINLLANQAAVSIQNAHLYVELEMEKRELRSRLVKAERLVVGSRFVASYVHRVNNLVGTIPIRIGQIEEELSDMLDIYQKLSPYLSGIVHDAERVMPVTEELNKLAGKEEPEKEFVDIKGVLKRVARRVRFGTPVDIQLVEKYPEGYLWVQAIPWEIADAFWNVLNNSASIMIPEGGGEIYISAARRETEQFQNNFVEISIHNTGPKIKEEDLKHMFEPFRSAAKNTGYGLWRTWHVIQDINGLITIQNDDNDKPFGVTTTISLPLAEKTLAK